MPLNEHKWENCSVQPLVNEFFEQDDIKKIQLKYCKRLKREYIADIIGSDSIRKIQRRLGLNK